MILAFVVAAVLQPASCHTISSDRILGKDLAAAAPELKALPAEVPISYAPAPGQIRIFRVAELAHIAAANNISTLPTADVCFSWNMSAPSGDKILTAVKKSLAGRNAEIEVIEQSRNDAPQGEIVFPLSGLTGVSDGAVIWRGYVTYAGDHHFAIWARVRIRIHETHVIATEALHPGVAISAEQIATVAYDGPLLRDKVVTDIRGIVGMIPRRIVPAGGVLTETDIEKPRDVERGDTVQVIAESGHARIEAQGIAQEAGRRGAVISVRNATSGKIFRARIDDKGRVTVIPGSFAGLAVEEHKS
jgi:flagella basal body P-ring formation protein FlgA